MIMSKHFSEEKEYIECEKLLFHGTKNTDPYDVMKCEEGFDMRFSNQGMWGNGIYFADQAIYSYRYSYTDGKDFSDKIRQMFLAKVLIGNSYKSEPDNKLKIPPKIEGSEERYDSVNGFSASSRIFIVYDNGKSYPEYLIKYSSKSLEDSKASSEFLGISPFSAPSNTTVSNKIPVPGVPFPAQMQPNPFYTFANKK